MEQVRMIRIIATIFALLLFALCVGVIFLKDDDKEDEAEELNLELEELPVLEPVE